MPYTVTATKLPGALILEPKVFEDARGFFYESFNAVDFPRAIGDDVTFVQDNHSKSEKGVLRGLHYQIAHAQGKLVRVTDGEVQDVIVDLRRNSPAFGDWISVELSAANKKQLWIPKGFAHGFLVLSDSAEFQYKTTDYWSPEHERTVLWSDSQLAIAWRLGAVTPVLSTKDQMGKPFAEAEIYL